MKITSDLGQGEGGQGEGELREQEAAGLHLHTPRAGQGVARRGVGVSVVTCITRFIKGVTKFCCIGIIYNTVRRRHQLLPSIIATSEKIFAGQYRENCV